MLGSQGIFLKKDFVNQDGIFLPEETQVLARMARRLCLILPNPNNPFSFGIGTRRFSRIDPAPQVELALDYGRPIFCFEECQQMLQIAARPKDYLVKLPNMEDCYDKKENALNNGVIIFDNNTTLASVQDDGGWFVFGLNFECALTFESDIFAVLFITGIIKTILAMDEDNMRLRAAYSAFLTTCENWSVALPEAQIDKHLKESGFKDFAYHRFEHHGPRKFFG